MARVCLCAWTEHMEVRARQVWQGVAGAGVAAALQAHAEWPGAESARQGSVAGAGAACILSQVALLQNVVVAWRRAKAWLRGVNRSGGRRAAERAWCRVSQSF